MAEWLAWDPDPETRDELSALVDAGSWDEIGARFAGRLTFGTAGLRAELGAGPLRMNRLVVRQAAAGLVAHLHQLDPQREPLVVVGFDARHKSDAFAADTAAVVAGAGGRCLWFDQALPTPVLAFAVRHFGADAGVMVTASHNPPADNGYKVFLGDGAQIIPPHDTRIAAAIDVAARAPVPVAEPDGHPAVTRVGAEVLDAYLEAIGGLSLVPNRGVVVAYTATHGVGGAVVAEAAGRAGFADWHVVDSQHRPDPDFGGMAFPNPEEPGVLDAVVALGREVGADVALANDPDADRLGVAVPSPGAPGGWRPLSGNEIGWLLADHVLANTAGSDRLVVTTVVSSRLLGRLAAAHGVRFAETLTGFKWVVRPGLADPTARFVFGYEEALGYLVGDVVRDKDGVSAALLLAEAVAVLRARGLTVEHRLAELGERFGYHRTASWSVRLPSRDGALDALSALMAGLRAKPPEAFGALDVEAAEDLLAGGPLPPTDALVYHLSTGGRLVVRPSGTEPKLKLYAEVVVADPATGDAQLAALRTAADKLLGG